MLHDPQNNREHLFNIPIETLGLSESAIKILGRVSVTSVGDWLDHFSRYGSGATIYTSYGFMQTMETEVLKKLVEHGYLTREEAKYYIPTSY